MIVLLVVGWLQLSRFLSRTRTVGSLRPLLPPRSPGGCPPRRSSAGRMAHKQIYYSDKYFDEHYEYR